MSEARRGALISLVRRHGWDLASVAAVVLTMVLHVRFVVLDDRAPTDLGHYYRIFQHLSEFWSLHGQLDWKNLDTPYSLLLTLLGMPFGPSVGLMEAVAGFWLLVRITGVWIIGRSVGGKLAGAVATVAVAGFPWTAVQTRTHWIHHPETAALIGALALWVSRPEIGSWKRAVGIAIFLFFGETIRETGIPFGVPLGILVLAGAAWKGARLKLLPPLLGLVGGIAWYAPVIASYIQKKQADAAGYAESVHKPWLLFVEGMSTPLFAVSVPFVVISLVALRKRDLGAAFILLALTWIGGAAAAVEIFHVGADNFPIAGIAWALLCGIGVASLPSWKFLPLRAIAFVLVTAGAAFIQTTSLLAEPVIRPVHSLVAPWGSAGPINYLRVYWNPMSVRDVLPLVEKTCGSTHEVKGAKCVIVSGRGLFNPSWEDGGEFALFLAGIQHVKVMTPQIVWDNQGRLVAGGKLVRAIVDVQCAGRTAPDPGKRFVNQSARFRDLLKAHATTRPDGTVGDPRGCKQSWYIIEQGVKVVQ